LTATEKYSKETCGAPVIDRTKLVSIAGLVGGSLAFLAFVLRIFARMSGAGGKVGLDDLCIFGTIVCAKRQFGLRVLTLTVA
jgi:hypothetical protein